MIRPALAALLAAALFAAGVPGAAGATEGAVGRAPVAEGRTGCLATRGDRVLAAESATTRFVPASVTKLVVAAAALHHLGPEFRATTELRAAVAPRGETLAGDLVLVAGGDPTWSKRYYPDDPRTPLRVLARFVRDRGVRRVEGDLVIDLADFPGRPFPPSRAIGELAYAWAAPSSGVVIDENSIAIDIAPGPRVGAPARASIPDREIAEEIRLENRMTTAPRERHERGTVDVLPGWDEPVVVLRGEYPISEPSYRMEIAAPAPELRVGRALVAALGEAGIVVTGGVRVTRSRVAAPVAIGVLRSAPLADLLPPILRESHNWHAEMLLRLLARAETGEGRSDDGLDLLVDFFQETVGVPEGDVHLDDASGLSPYNLLTPRAVVALLRFVLRQPWRDVYLRALPSPGTGTLEAWPALPPTLRAKTGTGRHALGLAGVVGSGGRGATNEPLVFACFSNHRPEDRSQQRAEIAAKVRAWAASR